MNRKSKLVAIMSAHQCPNLVDKPLFQLLQDRVQMNKERLSSSLGNNVLFIYNSSTNIIFFLYFTEFYYCNKKRNTVEVLHITTGNGIFSQIFKNTLPIGIVIILLYFKIYLPESLHNLFNMIAIQQTS